MEDLLEIRVSNMNLVLKDITSDFQLPMLQNSWVKRASWFNKAFGQAMMALCSFLLGLDSNRLTLQRILWD